MGGEKAILWKPVHIHDSDEIEVDISGYVSILIEGIEELQVKYEELKYMNYIEICE